MSDVVCLVKVTATGYKWTTPFRLLGRPSREHQPHRVSRIRKVSITETASAPRVLWTLWTIRQLAGAAPKATFVSSTSHAHTPQHGRLNTGNSDVGNSDRHIPIWIRDLNMQPRQPTACRRPSEAFEACTKDTPGQVRKLQESGTYMSLRTCRIDLLATLSGLKDGEPVKTFSLVGNSFAL